MKFLYMLCLKIVFWVSAIITLFIAVFAIFNWEKLQLLLAGIAALPAIAAWGLQKRELASTANIDIAFPQRELSNHHPETDIRCPHCAVVFDEMPKRKRRCPKCKEWIWPIRPPGMKYKRLTTVEQAQAWKLEDAKLVDTFAYALELAKQDKPFREALKDSHRQKLKQYQKEGMRSVSVDNSVCCDVCKRKHDKRVLITDELTNQRLPHADCDSPLYRHEKVIGWCTCDYTPH